MARQLKIMLIDDNGIDLFLHEKLISLQPYVKSVIKFTGTKDAINFLKNQESEKWPEVILLDIQMPVDDGFEFMIQYDSLPIENRKKCSVIMVSSSINLDDIMRAKANNQVLSLLIKPLNISELEKILKPILEF